MWMILIRSIFVVIWFVFYILKFEEWIGVWIGFDFRDNFLKYEGIETKENLKDLVSLLIFATKQT